jgi:hypothetical protein
MTEGQWAYLAQLTRALEETGLPGSRVGDLIAEMASHMDGTDLDPVEEFGTPGQMADALSADERRIPLWVRSLPVKLLAMWLVLAGTAIAFAAIADRPITAGSVGYAVAFGALVVLFRHVAVGRLDGRSLASMLDFKTLAFLIVGAGLASWVSMTETVLATPPRWSALIAAAAMIFSGFILIRVAIEPVRFPPEARHLKPLLRIRRGPAPR